MPSILVVEDKDSLRNMLSQTLEAEGYEVESAVDGPDGVKRVKEKQYDVVLTDLKMPGMDGLKMLSSIKEDNPDTEVILMTAYGTVENAVQAMKSGAFDFITKPFDTDQLSVLIKRAMENRRLKAENILLREELGYNQGLSGIIGSSLAMTTAIDLVRKVAPSESNVLFTGESGTGKELFARSIHELSRRKDGPFVAINCAAIPHELLENELFGSERGAFTGAVARKMGKFEIANGGSIFLDEVGDLDIALQAKLLRVLQEKNFERLGGNKNITVDVRVIAASNADLKDAIEKKTFREDLFYRLSVFPIQIPALRDRPEDLEELAEFFISKFGKEMKKGKLSLSSDAVKLLEKYHWPGNVRELENTIERAIILCEGKKIKPEHLAIRLRKTDEIRLRDGAGLKAVVANSVARIERELISRVLKQTRGNKRKASQVLQIDYTTLFEKLKKYSLDGKGKAGDDDNELDL
ncbi:MAG: sigma-54-dependent Fis family transcriptional regulator [candidate division Zixibacteria bacterium]|nr:sigma-54-dependent Fis family transcriptional regulator [candidate division Zixibacteria bacterium]